jgi:hypothetical protein
MVQGGNNSSAGVPFAREDKRMPVPDHPSDWNAISRNKPVPKAPARSASPSHEDNAPSPDDGSPPSLLRRLNPRLGCGVTLLELLIMAALIIIADLAAISQVATNSSQTFSTIKSTARNGSPASPAGQTPGR